MSRFTRDEARQITSPSCRRKTSSAGPATRHSPAAKESSCSSISCCEKRIVFRNHGAHNHSNEEPRPEPTGAKSGEEHINAASVSGIEYLIRAICVRSASHAASVRPHPCTRR